MVEMGSTVANYEVWLTSTTAPLVDEENGKEIDHERYEVRTVSSKSAVEKAQERQRRYNNNDENGKVVLIRKWVNERWAETT